MSETLAGLLDAAVRISVPLLLAVLGEIVVERAGVLNIGIEGMVLAGAFGGFAGAFLSGSPEFGLLLGASSGLTLGALLAWLVVRARVDAIVAGVALNILALGITGVFFRRIANAAGERLIAPTFTAVQVPWLSKLPLVGPAFFDQNLYAYMGYALVPATAFFLFRTLPGLRLRACGENPDAAAAAGVPVQRVRIVAVLFGALMAGIAGSYLSIAYSNTFVENMSAGRGFVALAIVVFARWKPGLGVVGALLFGAAMAFQVRFQGARILGVEAPYQFYQMLPYVLTLLVLGLSSRGATGVPAALGRPFRGRG
jgi:ABC-type uncharacterized transport system permease subunit